MADSRRVRNVVSLAERRPRWSDRVGASAVSPVTAAAQFLADETSMPVSVLVPQRYEAWHDEVWSYYESIGELYYGTEWLAQAMSRIRLAAAEVTPAGDEPEIIADGPAAELITNFAGGADAQAHIINALAVNISIPGEAYLIGRELSDDPYDVASAGVEPDADGRVWTVQPTHTVRPSRHTLRTLAGVARRTWDVQVDDSHWVTLPHESLITRVWDPHKRFPWRAMSPARAALPILREIDMYSRHIIATLISRIGLNGLLLVPDEVTLPANPRYENAVDPFVAELLDIMRQAIRNPGAPAAAAPLLLRIPGEHIERLRHLTFATPLDEKIWEAREKAVGRLAGTLNLPKEIITGMGSVNHWSGWQLEESAIKTHISPKMEIITRCLTVGYLLPMLRAANQPVTTKDGNRIIVWYDVSELTQRPDRSDMAVQLSDRVIISDTATRRETGFDESDAPTPAEAGVMLLRGLVRLGGQLAGPAYEELTGESLGQPPASPPDQAPVAGAPTATRGPAGTGGGTSDATQAEPAPTAPATGPPSTNGEPPPPPNGNPPSAIRGLVHAGGGR